MMEYVFPSYYPAFQCIGGACPDTCCAGWQIAIDAKSLERYGRCPGGLGNRLKNSVDFQRKSFLQYDGRCAFLNEENLCDIHAEAGPDMLCRTCRRYPRHVEAFENVREFSLNLSCPEAARMILTSDRLVLKYKMSERPMETEEDFDRSLFKQLRTVRDDMLHLVQNREIEIHGRMMMLLLWGYGFQRKLSQGKLSEAGCVGRRFMRTGAADAFGRWAANKFKDGSRYTVMQGIFEQLHDLDVISETWPDRLKHCERRLFGRGGSAYRNGKGWQPNPLYMEQLLAYFLYIYGVGAVYDHQFYEKIKLAVVSTMVIEDMVRAAAVEKGVVLLEDWIDAAHGFAKELEHSDDNLYRMIHMLMGTPKCHIRQLLSALTDSMAQV